MLRKGFRIMLQLDALLFLQKNVYNANSYSVSCPTSSASQTSTQPLARLLYTRAWVRNPSRMETTNFRQITV